MRTFDLYLNQRGNWVPVSSSEFSLPFSAYDEKLNENENSQYELTFSILKKELINDTIAWNSHLQFMFMGAKMRLFLDGSKRIDFVIKSISPSNDKDNSVYSVSAQDEVSYLWAKHNVGYNYSTTQNNVLTPKSIFRIAEDVLRDNFLDGEWAITTQSLDAELDNEKITLELTNSNPYNVLIEACNTVNAYMDVNYATKRLDFYRKDLIRFSGYRYHPQTNLTNYSANYEMGEFATMMHVSGGTDANDMVVSMVPAMPYAVKTYLNKQYDINSLPQEIVWPQYKDLINIEPEEIIVSIKEGSCNFNLEYDDDNTGILTGFTVTLNNGLSFTIGTHIVLNGQSDGWKELIFTRQKCNNTEFKYYELDGKVTFIISSSSAPSDIYDLNDTQYIQNYDLKLYTGFKNNSYLQSYNFSLVTPLCATTYYSQDTDEGFLENNNWDFYFSEYKLSTSSQHTESLYNIVNKDSMNFQVKIQDTTENSNELVSFVINRDDFVFNFIKEDNVSEVLFEKDFDSYTIKCLKVLTTTTENKPIILYYSYKDLIDNQSIFFNKQKNEIEVFNNIINKVPYLGQTLINFSPFYFNLTEEEKTSLNNLINVTLRNLNIQKQYYATDYYAGISQLTQMRNDMINLAEIYGAACLDYQSAADDKKDKAENNVKEAYNNLKSYIQNPQYFTLIQYLGIDGTKNDDWGLELYYNDDKSRNPYNMYFYNLIDTAQTNTDKYVQLRSQQISPSSVIGTSETQYYNNLIKTNSTLYMDFANVTIDDKPARGIYQTIIDIINENTPSIEVGEGIIAQFKKIDERIKYDVMQPLYNNFGQYIYETSYENADEFDSVSLFNQAYAHFTDINRFQSSHSLEVLDIGTLESIGTPRLAVGSLISVYNENSINMLPFAYALGQIEAGNDSDNRFRNIIINLYDNLYFQIEQGDIQEYYYWINNTKYFINRKLVEDKRDYDKWKEGTIFIIETLGEDKKIANRTLYTKTKDFDINKFKGDNTQLFVLDKDHQFRLILSHLFSDTILVTGISRTLREPLKDSVTVQQPSRYKTILAKLIKSI